MPFVLVLCKIHCMQIPEEASLFFLHSDMVAALGEVTGKPALRYMHQRMSNDAVGRLILQYVQSFFPFGDSFPKG